MNDSGSRESDDHFLCLRWAAWHHSRRLYAPPPPKNLLAKMRVPDATILEAPSAPNDPELCFLNRAINAQRQNEQKQTFLCYYLHRIPVPALMDHYSLTREGLKSRIERFRRRVIVGQHALIAGGFIDSNVIELARRRRDWIRATRGDDGRITAGLPLPKDAPKTGKIY